MSSGSYSRGRPIRRLPRFVGRIPVAHGPRKDRDACQVSRVGPSRLLAAVAGLLVSRKRVRKPSSHGLV